MTAEQEAMAKVILLSCATRMNPITAMHYARNLTSAGYGKLPQEPEGQPMINVPIKRLHGEAAIPSRAKDSDAGYDLHAIEAYDLGPGEREMLRTGIAVAIPRGYVGYIKPRSGLAARNGLDVLGGVIDAGYRGEIGVILLNTDLDSDIHIAPGDRIAQLVIQPVATVAFDERYDLEASERAGAGFGSTGA